MTAYAAAANKVCVVS